MRIGAFELAEPVPELNEPHALTIIPSWMDAGRSASLTLSLLEQYFEGGELARLARPGEFFDFTRYRPMLSRKENASEVTLTNAVVNYGRREAGCDFIFLRLPEPHAMAEVYIDSVLELLKSFGVKRYGLVGSIYDMVPYTRPLLVTGGAVGSKAIEDLDRAEVGSSDYEGPTTICHLISQQAATLGIETMTLITHLPQYTELDEDYMGQVRLMEVFYSLYGVPVDEADIQKAEKQRRDIDIAVNRSRKIKEVVAQLEAHYDARTATKKTEEMPHLSPEIESFLKEMERRFRQG